MAALNNGRKLAGRPFYIEVERPVEVFVHGADGGEVRRERDGWRCERCGLFIDWWEVQRAFMSYCLDCAFKGVEHVPYPDFLSRYLARYGVRRVTRMVPTGKRVGRLLYVKVAKRKMKCKFCGREIRKGEEYGVVEQYEYAEYYYRNWKGQLVLHKRPYKVRRVVCMDCIDRSERLAGSQ